MYAEPVLISKFMCYSIISINRIVILLHNWLFASLAVTRCYAIYQPINSTTRFSSKFYFRLNLIVLFCFTFTFVLLNIFGVMPLSYQQNSSTTAFNESWSNRTYQATCQISQDFYKQYKYIDVYINITLGIVGYSLPCFITLITNLMLIYNIKKAYFIKKVVETKQSNNRQSFSRSEEMTETTTQQQRNHLSNAVNEMRTKVNKSRYNFFKATSSLLLISISYLICYIPYSVLFLLLSLDKINLDQITMFSITCLKYLNHTLNFYIYFATGKKFRNDVLNLFRRKKKKKMLERKSNFRMT